jgi:hypothetical protein
MALGFGEYEARAYAALLVHGTLSGYEVSKHSGVPRPNVYPVLQRLEERGAVMALDARRGSRYAARPVDEYLERLERSYHDRVAAARSALSRLGSTRREPVGATVAGEDELLARARGMIDGASAQVLLAVAPATAQLLTEPASGALARGVDVTTLCLRACPSPCGACHGSLFRHDAGDSAHDGWMVVVADDRELLAADLAQPGGDAAGLVTRHPALVQMAASSVRDGIAAAEIIRNLGDRVRDAVDPAAHAALTGAPLADSRRRSWLDRIRARLGGHAG